MKYDLILDGDVRVPEISRQPCEIWTRVMGYYRPVSRYNAGKQSEYNERKFFDEDRD